MGTYAFLGLFALFLVYLGKKARDPRLQPPPRPAGFELEVLTAFAASHGWSLNGSHASGQIDGFEIRVTADSGDGPDTWRCRISVTHSALPQCTFFSQDMPTRARRPKPTTLDPGFDKRVRIDQGFDQAFPRLDEQTRADLARWIDASHQIVDGTLTAEFTSSDTQFAEIDAEVTVAVEVARGLLTPLDPQAGLLELVRKDPNPPVAAEACRRLLNLNPTLALELTGEAFSPPIRAIAAELAAAQQPGFTGRLNIAEPDKAGAVSVMDRPERPTEVE